MRLLDRAPKTLLDTPLQRGLQLLDTTGRDLRFSPFWRVLAENRRANQNAYRGARPFWLVRGLNPPPGRLTSGYAGPPDRCRSARYWTAPADAIRHASASAIGPSERATIRHGRAGLLDRASCALLDSVDLHRFDEPERAKLDIAGVTGLAPRPAGAVPLGAAVDAEPDAIARRLELAFRVSCFMFLVMPDQLEPNADALTHALDTARPCDAARATVVELGALDP